MTTEEKAKRYDEAVNKLRRFMAQGIDPLITRADVQDFFPELKESEDEQHRKWILEYLYDGLRKSDEQFKPQFASAIGWLENQDGKKHTDKVEQRFHEGDWCRRRDGGVKRPIKITKVLPLSYEAVNDIGYHHSIEKDCLENNYDLWNIDDAKAGDVLFYEGIVKYANGIKYERICLFNNLDNAFFTLTKTLNCVETYDVYVNIDYPDNTVPATKEQREILFMAMTDAGYTFDFEKKKLRKIEQSELTEFEDAVEEMMNSYRDAIGANDVTTEEVKKHAKYLLSLIPHKHVDWSEEDERAIGIIKIALEHPYDMEGKWDRKFALNWLKSLRPQKQWKPTKEQIDALEHFVRSIGESDYASPYDNNTKLLYSLLEQLKKL